MREHDDLNSVVRHVPRHGAISGNHSAPKFLSFSLNRKCSKAIPDPGSKSRGWTLSDPCDKKFGYFVVVDSVRIGRIGDIDITVVGDLSRRRGQIVGTEDSPSGKVVTAEVPLAEMFQYSTSMRSMSQGRANYTMEFAKYQEVPGNVADVVMKKAS